MMDIRAIQARLKPWMMPIAIVLGFLFHGSFARVDWVVPYCIFTILLLTFCKIRPRDLVFERPMWILLGVQLGGAILVYFLLATFNVTVAQAVMMCVICPVATAAPVVTGLLGGKIGKVATFSVLSNLGLALVLPGFLACIAPETDVGFVDCLVGIAMKVTPVLVLPMLIAFGLQFSWPKAHKALASCAPLSFYIWSASLIIVVGRSVSFVMAEPRSYWPVMILMAMGAAVVCVLQFYIGKHVGRSYGDSITYGQCLGQKNTMLAIWLSTTYLSGVSSVGPAAYVIWHNCFNSWQIYQKTRRERAETKRSDGSEHNDL